MNRLVVNSIDDLPGVLRAERIKQSLSQQQLANLAGVGVKTVGTAELGVYTPHVSVILAIVKALGYDSIEFILEAKNDF